MGTNIQFYLIHKRLLDMVSYVNMVSLISSLLGFLWRFLFHVVCFITKYLIRLLEKKDEKSQRIDDRIVGNGETKREEKEDKDCDGSETRSSILFLSSAKKYEVFAVKDINGFIEEPKAASFTVRELYLGSEDIPEAATAASSDVDEGFASLAMESEIFEAEEEEYWKNKFEFFSGRKKDTAMIDDLFSGSEEFVIEKESLSGIEEETAEIGNRISSFEIDDLVSGSKDLVIRPRKVDKTEESGILSFEGEVREISNRDSSLEIGTLMIDGLGAVEGSFLGFIELSVEPRERDKIEDFSIVETESQTSNIEIAEIGNRDLPTKIDESRPFKNNHDGFGVSEDLFSTSKDAVIEKESKASSIEEEVVEIRNRDSSSKIYDSVSIENGHHQHVTQEEKPLVSFSSIEENVVEIGNRDPSSKIDHSNPIKNNHHIVDQHIDHEEKLRTSVSEQDSEFQDKCTETNMKTSCPEFWGREKKEEQKMGEFEWEHEDVIEQLKLELKRARAGGLSTILEEESGDDEDSSPEASLVKLRSVKIEFKFGFKERIEEIQKVYKIYADRMRKLDILNNQTMHALGFLQLKDQSKSTLPKQKPTMMAMSFLPRIGHRQNDASFAPKNDTKLQNDFESVYVGQVCLSWEILRWQHGRLRDLLQNNNGQVQRGLFRHVASEFQLFQVLVNRFVEDESYRGPRVQNYVKNRCVLRSLIQVPMIRDDSVKDKQHVVDEKEEVVSCEDLEKIIVDSMLTFWEFIRKDEKNMDSQHGVIEPGDSRLLMDIRKEFHKKERKVKDIERSGNCVVKKLQKKQGQSGIEGHELLLAMVELRLVSRVLGMSRLSRDHLVWCQHKLNQISFLNKKIHLEISFLLFPC